MHLKITAMLVSCFFSVLLCLQPNAHATSISEDAYPYPYQDPYLATATAGILQGSEHPPTSEIKDLRLRTGNHRNHIYLLEGKGRLRYRFYQQKNGPAPLVFIIPGLAGSSYSGAARFLAEWFADNGFHALILPSRFNWNFALAASTSGYPGSIQDDSRDLYAVMRRVLDEIKNRCHAQIGPIGMLGLSDGALFTAYLSRVDAEQRQIGIATYLLVNPPVDMLEAARKIDRMAALGKDYGSAQKTYLEAYAFGVLSRALNNDIDDPDYFANWDKRLRLADKDIEYLIGKSLLDSIGDSIYAADLANHAAILKTPISWGNRSGRLYEARSYGLMRYVETFLIPNLRQTGNREINLKTLDTQNSVRGIASELARDTSVFLMHNRDDILVSAEDIALLEKVFGERATVYPYGGHLGNLWYPVNKQHMLEVFSPLLQRTAQSTP